MDRRPEIAEEEKPPSAPRKKEAWQEKACRALFLFPAFVVLKERLGGFFRDDSFVPDRLANENEERARHAALCRRVQRRAWIIAGLLLLLVVLAPILRPIYNYETWAEGKVLQPLAPLDVPNLTDQAILSWAATSITEIMTFGFGDFETRILGQRPLFTAEGWESFTKAIRAQNMRENFKLRQLVLTSVPANMPVIIGKGVDQEGQYKWLVEMPIIMTYTTNNNVTTRQRGFVQLTIVRVPPRESVMGVGIKTWKLF